MTTRATSRFLDLRALAALEHMRFTTRRRVEGTFMGYHQSRQQGGAGEFVDFREYTGGEDLRRLDWKVLARTGKAFVRLHEEETNLACTLAIDASGSMRFGAAGRRDPRGSKLEYVQYLATALSHVISRSQDQVGLAVLDGALSEWLAPAATASHVEHLQEIVENLETHASLRMAGGLRDLFERSPPPRRAAGDERFPHGRPGRRVRGAAAVPPSRLGHRRAAPGPSRRGAAARGRRLSLRGHGGRGPGELFAGRDSRRVPAAVRGPPGDGPPVGPGRRLRLPPRFDGHSVFADLGGFLVERAG